MEKLSTSTHDHDHEHEQEHDHDHSHGGKLTIIMFFVGVAAFIAGYVLEGMTYDLLANISFVMSVITAGYHIILEGIGDTISNS
ncbi:heavy metal translocating P-type ATPase, partial [Enterococcus sp. S181_ASV_20]|nr:heavy metal translocating P-type ATPase [Enterococcus sp. S181_ASV_20]